MMEQGQVSNQSSPNAALKENYSSFAGEMEDCARAGAVQNKDLNSRVKERMTTTEGGGEGPGTSLT